ncbi:hypothetical protein O3P69_007958 [Scylla paramamosain]|uniref:Uncharacterized protein n=1 Tax=Scylla paramamosain TaxID=85552 RepID=A0AAW0T1C3_SCYPA
MPPRHWPADVLKTYNVSSLSPPATPRYRCHGYIRRYLTALSCNDELARGTLRIMLRFIRFLWTTPGARVMPSLAVPTQRRLPPVTQHSL